MTDKPNKITKAMDAYLKLRDRQMQLRVHSKIANEPLPPHKQKKHDQLIATAIMNVRNAETAFEDAYKKLSDAERAEFWHPQPADLSA